MNQMNWGAWIQGVISSICGAAVIVITALLVLSTPPKGWQLFVIAIGPFAINFFSFIKQNPPPIHWNGKERRDLPEPPKP